MARADLVAGTDKLSSELDGCIKLVQAIETKFDLWSKAARDLETSVTDTSGRSELLKPFLPWLTVPQLKMLRNSKSESRRS